MNTETLFQTVHSVNQLSVYRTRESRRQCSRVFVSFFDCVVNIVDFAILSSTPVVEMLVGCRDCAHCDSVNLWCCDGLVESHLERIGSWKAELVLESVKTEHTIESPLMR